jgi:hypothetical protein
MVERNLELYRLVKFKKLTLVLAKTFIQDIKVLDLSLKVVKRVADRSKDNNTWQLKLRRLKKSSE